MYAKTDEKGVVFEFVEDGQHAKNDVFVGDGPYELAAEDTCFKYKIENGELVERTQEERDKDWVYFDQPSQEEIYAMKVDALVREHYSVSDELALLRQRDTKPDEFAAYNDYVEQCKQQAREEVFGNGLSAD